MDRANLQNTNKKLWAIPVALVLLVGGFLLVKNILLAGNNPGVSGVNTKVATPDAKSTLLLNREFNFPLKDKDGKEVNQFRFVIESAELRDEIVVKGKRAAAVEGRTFLILIVKLTNSLNQSLSINTKDYIRLSVNGNEGEWLAPDIHNDPVTVQSISTKPTRLGFPINDSDTQLKLQVGEVSGEKTVIDLNFDR